MLAGDFDEFGVEVGDEDLFFVVAGLGEDAAEGVGDEAAAPELDAGVRGCGRRGRGVRLWRGCRRRR